MIKGSQDRRITQWTLPTSHHQRTQYNTKLGFLIGTDQTGTTVSQFEMVPKLVTLWITDLRSFAHLLQLSFAQFAGRISCHQKEQKQGEEGNVHFPGNVRKWYRGDREVKKRGKWCLDPRRREALWLWTAWYWDINHSVFHELGSEWVSEWTNEWTQQSARGQQTVRSKQKSEKCEQTDERVAQKPMSWFLVALNHSGKVASTF